MTQSHNTTCSPEITPAHITSLDFINVQCDLIVLPTVQRKTWNDVAEEVLRSRADLWKRLADL